MLHDTAEKLRKLPFADFPHFTIAPTVLLVTHSAYSELIIIMHNKINWHGHG